MEETTSEWLTEQVSILLNKREISEVKSLFRKKDLDGAKKYLNEPMRKMRLKKKGVIPDFLYHQLEMRLSK